MRLYNVYGKLQSKKVSKYLIDWDKKSKSNIQFETKQFLKVFWENHIVYEEFPVYGTKLKVDFINATKKIAIEVNGVQHSQFNKFFHNNSRAKYLESIKRDVKKREWLELNNFKIVEIEQNEVKDLSKEWFKKEFDIIL
tara:strand:- start:897 stop:1313 length:417 start_codon:yes stop_codon:yes gene_type:complete